MALSYSLPIVLSPPPTGREAVADALYRCLTAFDLDDETLFDSSFMPDGIFEINGRPMKGLTEIHNTGLTLVKRVDTTHMATNVRVHMKTETEASVTCTVLSQHYPKGKGMEPNQKSLMAGNLYRGELCKEATGLWKFQVLQIKSMWAEGDWEVLGGRFDDQQ